MRILERYESLLKIALRDFRDIVLDGKVIYSPAGIAVKLRLFLVDNSILDIWLSSSGRYSYHWESVKKLGIIYRHDNAPHKRWRHVKSFPRHFHDGSENKVRESELSEDPEKALREFLSFLRKKL